ncbi:MAG: 50S ribosomal protein L4 [Caulobacteraceae bacterium]|nr:50S ribosomal protein L4 [Caulobacteraceae bacterium]
MSASSLRASAISAATSSHLGAVRYEAPIRQLVQTYDGRVVGEVDLAATIFNQEPRGDLLHRYVRWQESRRHKGQHKTKTRNEVSRTTHKMYKQKGTGGARHGSRSAPQFIGGAKAHGPVLRDKSLDLPKKVRTLGLLQALSCRAYAGDIQIIDQAELETYKTRALVKTLANLKISDVLIIHGDEPCHNLRLASANLHYVDLLPVEGLNVLSILRRSRLLITTEALHALTARFLGPDSVDRSGYDIQSRRPSETNRRALVERERVYEAQRQDAWAYAQRKVRRTEAAAYRPAPVQASPSERPTEDVANDDLAKDGSDLAFSQPEASNEVVRRYLQSLKLGARKDRMEAMKAIGRTSLPSHWEDEAVRRLVPLLISDDPVEARRAAEVLCQIRYDEETARPDLLTEILHEEGVDFVTHVDASRGPKPSRVHLHARVGSALPFTLDGEAVSIEIPDWLEAADSLYLKISGPAVVPDTVVLTQASIADGDLLATDVAFDMTPGQSPTVYIDFFADNRWLDRRTVVVTP